jgi:type IV pilus assembly protein PilW
MTLGATGALGPAQELVDGVEDMQILYGLDGDGDRAADQYVTASAIAAADWNQVVSIQINWLIQTTEDRLADQATPYVLYDGSTASLTPVTPSDSRLRRVFSSTVAVRNRAL